MPSELGASVRRAYQVIQLGERLRLGPGPLPGRHHHDSVQEDHFDEEKTRAERALSRHAIQQWPGAAL